MATTTEGGLLCAPPTDFKRMLSWKLSGPPVSSSKKKAKRGKKQRLRDDQVLSKEQPILDDDNFDQFDDDFGNLNSYGYIVVNSEGEEEVYFSAPESPMSSDNDFDDVTTTSSDWLATNVCSDLPQQERKPGGRSKKSKKKSRYLTKLAQVEFFQPLCDLFEEKASLDVGRLDVSSQAEVPTLVELSIRKIRGKELVHLSNDLPFLVHCLLGHDRQLRQVVSTHVRWLERLLAAFEVTARQQREDRQQNTEKDSEEGCAYCQQASWDAGIQLNELPRCGSGLHCPLPDTFSHRWLQPYDSVSKVCLMKPLFHFANYFFPLFTAKGKDAIPQDGVSEASPISPSQRAAICYVTNFLKSRYESLTSELSETLKLWPGYVYWARGQLKLAADSFAATIDALTHSYDQAVALNEVGRMFLHFGDRKSAFRFFCKSAAVATKVPGVYNPTSDLVSPCAFALEASAWDCGWLDGGVAREAARGWGMVVKEAANLPIVFWFLHVAACESRLFIHAGRPVGSDPSSPLESASAQTGVSPTHQWLSECEKQLLKFSEKFQILHYHLSLVYAMQKMSYLSHKAFQSFHDEYSGFREWPDGILPGDLFPGFPSIKQRNPWTPLIDLLTNQKLSHAPVLQLQWRVRLLHPVYPYVRPEGVCYLAEHGSPNIGLRFTRDGYLTADLHMDLPPMRCVLIDPYTGSLCFSRSASLQHYFMNPFGERLRQELCLLPWPLRLFESERCVVELVEGSTTDVELSMRIECNYMAVLHWYDNEGTHRKLDVRRIIRKNLRKEILALAQRKGLEGKEAMLDKMMERGYYVGLQDLQSDTVPSKYIKQKGSGKETTKPRKVRNQRVLDFVLHLTSHVVYGEGTLMLCFLLDPWMEDYSVFQGQVLMFVDCTSCDSFLNPRVYCIADNRGFKHLYPSTEMASAYTNRHLRHISYAMAVCTEQLSNPSIDKQLVFDRNGDIVHEEYLKPTSRRNPQLVPRVTKEDVQASFTLGDHLFFQENGKESKVLSLDTQLSPESMLSSVPFQSTTILDIIPVPGLLLVHTPKGLCLLHPGSLQPVTIEGLKEAAPDPADLNPHIQFKGNDMIFQVLKVYNVERPCTEEVVAKHGSEYSEEQEVESVSPAGDTPEEEGLQTRPGQCETLREGERTSSDNGAEFTTEAVKTEGEAGCKERRDSTDFGSCYVAFTINNRLLVLAVSHRTESVSIMLDVRLPGKVTEFHEMGKLGYMLSVTQFPDQFREEVYWLTESGELLGMLPCLGAGPRSFLSATLNPRPSSGSVAATSHYQTMEARGLEEEDNGGLYVFFNDGQGGICCVRN